EVLLTGRQLQSGTPVFPAVPFLADRGLQRVASESERQTDWRGRYTRSGRSHGLVLKSSGSRADVTAPISADCRLVVYTSNGPLEFIRGVSEASLLQAAIGQALSHEELQPLDVLAVAVPRSVRMRKVVQQFRTAPRLQGSGIQLLTVDRTGDVHGLFSFDVPGAG